MKHLRGGRDVPPVMKITFPERSGMSFAGIKDTLLVVKRPYNIAKSSMEWNCRKNEVTEALRRLLRMIDCHGVLELPSSR